MRKSTPRGQMTRGANTGPAIMLLPPHVRASFMPNPPLAHVPPVRHRRKTPITGVGSYMKFLETTPPPARLIQPTPKDLREKRKAQKAEEHTQKLQPEIDAYKKSQKESEGEYQGMNCYNTLFIGRLAYEVNEAKLLREMENFGRVKDIRIITSKDGKSRGYAFCEFYHDDDMKRAYRSYDGVRLEGRHILVDVERGHTVPSWLPRRLGGGLGGTRIGGKYENITLPGRFDPKVPDAGPPPMMGGMGRGGGGPPPPQYGGGGPGGYRDGGGYGGGRGDRYGGPPPPPRYGDRGGDWGRDRKRHRSRSPDRWERDNRRRY